MTVFSQNSVVILGRGQYYLAVAGSIGRGQYHLAVAGESIGRGGTDLVQQRSLSLSKAAHER